MENQAVANIISRDECVICGVAWVNEVFKQLDTIYNTSTKITWFVNDGQHVKANTTLFELSGNARILLTGERTALNFLQSLSGTATITSDYVKHLAGTTTKLSRYQKNLARLTQCTKVRRNLWRWREPQNWFVRCFSD